MFPWERPRLADALIGLAFLAGFNAAAAAEAPLSDPMATQPALKQVWPLALRLDVSLNGRRLETISPFSQFENGRLGARLGELTSLGVEARGRAGDLIALDSIPGLTYVYDEARQSIALTVPPGGLRPRTLRARPRDEQPRPRPEADWGGVLNYGLYGSFSHTGKHRRYGYLNGASASLDARLFSPLGVARQTGIVGETLLSPGPGLRLDSTISHFDDERLLTYRAGDSISGGLAWTRPVHFGGFQVQRSFGLRPDIVTAPLPILSGTAAAPSTLDVFVNEQKIMTSELAAGRFVVDDLPMISGNGDARMVVRDASGREVKTTTRFYVTPEMLRPGVFDFSLEAGAPRIGYGVESFDYQRKPFAAWTLRGGVTNELTLQSHGEMSGRLQNAGLGVLGSAFGLGAFNVAGAMSFHDGRPGELLYVGGQTRLYGLSVQASTQVTFGDYEDIASLSLSETYLRRLASLEAAYELSPLLLSALTNARTPRRIDQLTLGLPFRPLDSTLALTLVNERPVVGPSVRVAGVSLSKALRNGGTLSASAYVNVSATRSLGLFAGFTLPLGDFGYGSVGASSGDSYRDAALSLVKPLGSASGSTGWRLQDQEGTGYSRVAELSHRSSYGVHAGRLVHDRSGLAASAELDGSIAATRDGFFVADRIDDSFGVVRTGAADVEVLVENKPAGRTNARGLLLVPNLRSFEPNRISIDASTLPLDSAPSRTEATVAPLRLSGALIDFGGRTEGRAAELTLVDSSGKPIPVGSPGKQSNGADFVVGYEGQAFVTGAKSTDWVAVQLENGSCRADFTIVSPPGRRAKLGPQVCR